MITALLSVTMSGKLLPPQVLYAGKSDRCHPDVAFPPGWDIWHSPNHWSNTETMIRFLDNIILPYIESQRKVHGDDQKALCIFDVFAPHRSDAVLKKLDDARILYKFVPAGCTGELQPLDVSVNNIYKKRLSSKFEEWYSEEVQRSMDSGKSVNDINVDISLSRIKPINAQWLIDSHQLESGIIRDGFVKAGLLSLSHSEADTVIIDSD